VGRRQEKKISIATLSGINLRKLYAFIARFPAYLVDYRLMRRLRGTDLSFPLYASMPILHEKNSDAGVMSGAYFHQDLLVARRIFENKPLKHVDIGSRIDGFVAHVAVFRSIEVLDIRNQTDTVKNIKFRQADLLNLPSDKINYTDSISSLHAIEHFGLGRYGDSLSYDGHIKGINNITQILKRGGKFYFSTPIGRQRIEFNAHRVFSVRYLLDLLTSQYTIDHFSYVSDAGELFENVALDEQGIVSNFGCSYGCGIWELTKK